MATGTTTAGPRHGALLETKPVSVAVHVRNVADRERAHRITEEVIAGPGSWSGVHITTGKEVVELSDKITKQKPWLNELLKLVRFMESGSVKSRIDDLLD